MYTPPRFGSTAPQVPTADTEPPASAAQRKDLEVAIGYLLLYYGRLVDSRILPYTCPVPSPASNLLLRLALSSASIVSLALSPLTVTVTASFTPQLSPWLCLRSPLILTVTASFTPPISVSPARAASLGPSTISLVCLSRVCLPTLSPSSTVLSPRDPCGVLLMRSRWCATRSKRPSTLASLPQLDLGYPQPRTLLLCDNESAVGLATKTMTPRLSKSSDMRFHWLQDRIQRGQLCVQHVAGDVNIADFFTDALPRIKHAHFAPYCALDPAALGNRSPTLALFCSY